MPTRRKNMKIYNSVIKEISDTIIVFLFSLFIGVSSFLRGYFMRVEDYDKNKLIIVPIFAVIITLVYVLFKKKYLNGMKKSG
jgi:O-antigen/teichoic acid export membrane protein